MEQLLQDNGYSVALAVDGFDALERIGKEPPAVLVTDLEMPNLNGLELTRRLRSMPQWEALPIVMITSRATDKHRDMAGEAGVDLYLSKPYVDIDLLAHLRRLATNESKVEIA
jgi:chemosensory pili system protein ChpA (sensor histidine kinase/response regulator)